MYIAKKKLDQEGDSDNFDDMDVTTYGVVGKLLQEVTEDDKQKLLEFWTIILTMRWPQCGRSDFISTLNAEEDQQNQVPLTTRKMPAKCKY